MVDAAAVVCKDIQLVGEVSVGARTVVQPRAHLVVEDGAGPILIGTNNIIEENVVIVNRQPTPLVIGNGNKLSSGAYVDSATIGDGNIIEEKAKLNLGVSIGNDSIVVACLTVPAGTAIVDKTILFGTAGQTRSADSATIQAWQAFHKQHLDYLIDIIPRFNHLHGRSSAKSENPVSS